MSSLTAIFGNSEDKSEDSEKLLNLYWNRAELKKEFAGMRDEQYRLRDEIKQQEGANARLQQKLDHLEDLLIDPDWVYNVVVFYQLRGLALRCERKVDRFAEQLKQQREQKAHGKVMERWNAQQRAESAELKDLLLDTRNSQQMLEDQLQSERRRLSDMNGLMKLFRKRSLTRALDQLADQIDNVQQEELALNAQLNEINNRPPPDNEGLDIAAKRSINLMIFAFVQQIVANFDDIELAALVKESSEKSVGAINYGTRHECAELLDLIADRVITMDAKNDFAEQLKKRARIMSERVQFRAESDAVPIPSSLGPLILIDSNGTIKEKDVNVLEENYWGVGKFVSR